MKKLKLPRRKTPDERLKLALVKHVERSLPGAWLPDPNSMRVRNISSSWGDEYGVRVVVELAR